MCDKMAISAYILKIVEKDLFLRLQMRAKEMFNRRPTKLDCFQLTGQLDPSWPGPNIGILKASCTLPTEKNRPQTTTLQNLANPLVCITYLKMWITIRDWSKTCRVSFR